ncbi:hypothetical protein ACP70R_026751 [Stipagrostis hirtigluma subsp. patula]
MVEDTKPSQGMVDVTGRAVLPDVSYEKDIVEIKLADTADSNNYGDNFVKDVCVDEGAPFHRKYSEEKPADIKTSPNFSCQMIDSNCDIRYGKKDDGRKYVHELKPEAVVPVDFAPDCNGKQYSSGNEYDREDWITTCYTAVDPSDKKISLQELLRLESAEESRHAGTVNSEGSEKHKHPLREEAVGQASSSDSHEAQAIAPKSCENVSSGRQSKDDTSGCSATMSEEHDAAAVLDVRQPNKIDRYNPCVDHRSLAVEDTSEPECCIPEITNAASTEHICTIDNTDSFSNMASGSTGLNGVETVESEVTAVSSSNSDIQSSENSDDHSKGISSKAITGAEDETAVSTSSSPNNVKPSDANGENQERCETNGTSDVHDINEIDEDNCIDTEDAVRTSSTLAENDAACEQTAPESSKSTACIGNGDPSEPFLFGPSIMSGPVSISGHMAYAGNTSLRSDSSTTSTRSFAFPVTEGVDQQPGEDGKGGTQAYEATPWLEERTWTYLLQILSLFTYRILFGGIQLLPWCTRGNLQWPVWSVVFHWKVWD